MNDARTDRLLWIDNIRLTMIILVVLVHLNVTYSGFGMWYCKDSSGMGRIQSLLMGGFGSFTQAYFMGFLFFIAGFFVPEAYDRKGFGSFLRDRLIRLGIPSLLYMLLIHPFTVAVLLPRYYAMSDPASWAVQYYTSFSFLGASGPLWFAVALLFFTLVYALMRVTGLVRSMKVPCPGNLGILLFIAVLSAAAFLIRIVQPIGTNILNMQLCYFAQYVGLFAAGIAAKRNGWLDLVSRRFALRWFAAALSIGSILWLLLMLFGGPGAGNVAVIEGGLRWQAAVYAFWESFFCAGVCLGLIVVFRDFLNRQKVFVRFLSAHAFGVYVLHAPVLVAVFILFRDVHLLPLEKALLAAPVAVAASFAVSAVVRMVPGTKRII